MIELLIVAAVMIISYLSFRQGKKSEKAKGQEEILNVIEDVRKARGNLSNRDYVERLLRKYSK